ncbi:hypothetical protein DY000_02036764 [Brassica cretica]|uniref:non-specific serine/threonine protein kinase n=1 Tax=Brassica cretica TaxID=69181 RepID=A0ABQ7BRI0_BRACR|nr:hypothetical protein DY000_02036764 [Brassica cretica]
MSLSPSASPAPADSPPATSSPPAPPLSPLPPPLGSPPPLAPPPSILPPTASPPPPSPPLEAPPSPPLETPPVPPEEPPPSPPEEPTLSPPSPSGSPPLPFLPAKPSPPPSPLPSETLPPPGKTDTPPPPSLPSELPPPVNAASPPPPSPPRRRGPKPSLPPPISSSPPKTSPSTPSLPETSPPPKPPPFPSSSTPAPKNSPATTTLPFFGPVGPPDGTIAAPIGPIIEPKTTPGETISPGTAQPLVPKSLPETTPYHRSSAGFLFGGVIVGALLLVLLGLLFVFYRATRNRNNNSSRHGQSKTPPPKVQHQRGGYVEPNQSNVITIPPPNYSSSVSYGTKEKSNAIAMNVTISSGTFTYEELLEATGGFSEANLLGEGGFGYVHKGVLRNGREVAVKQLKIGSNQGEREFQAEVDTISRVHHKHLVSLVCYIKYPRVRNRDDPWVTVTSLNPRGRVQGSSELEDPLQPSTSGNLSAAEDLAAVGLVVDLTDFGEEAVVHVEDEPEIGEFHQDPDSDSSVQHQRGGYVEPNQSNVITIPPPNYSSSVSYGTKEKSNAIAMNVTISSGTFTYEELLEATGGFSEANLLGEGGFGYVHKGVLRNGREVAVKQLKIGSNQGEREFQAEVDTISRVHHKHLVSLVGYCINGDKRLLIYEFVPKDTLEFHLHGNRGSVLEWGMRLRIAVGAAKGLAYLHEDCSPTIIHRDIKAANILLDSKYEAKVSDFGLAKFFSDTNSSVTHISTRVVGTFGYMAPEYASSGKVTDKSDVYSFGVVLLELITGRPPIFAKDPTRNQSLVDWARPLLAKAISGESFDLLVDPRLEKNYDTTQMADMAACAASCIRQSAWLRPRMSQVIRALEGEVTLRNVEETYSSSENPLPYGTSKRRFNTDSSNGSTSEYGINPSQSSSEQHQFTGSKV